MPTIRVTVSTRDTYDDFEKAVARAESCAGELPAPVVIGEPLVAQVRTVLHAAAERGIADETAETVRYRQVGWFLVGPDGVASGNFRKTHPEWGRAVPAYVEEVS